jgi:hypothetical protein
VAVARVIGVNDLLAFADLALTDAVQNLCGIQRG